MQENMLIRCRLENYWISTSKYLFPYFLLFLPGFLVQIKGENRSSTGVSPKSRDPLEVETDVNLA